MTFCLSSIETHFRSAEHCSGPFAVGVGVRHLEHRVPRHVLQVSLVGACGCAGGDTGRDRRVADDAQAADAQRSLVPPKSSPRGVRVLRGVDLLPGRPRGRAYRGTVIVPDGTHTDARSYTYRST